MNKLDEFYLRIVRSHIKVGQESAGNPVSTPEPVKTNTLNQDSSNTSGSSNASKEQPAASSTSTTAPKPKMLADVSKPSSENKDSNQESSTNQENKQENKPSQGYQAPEGYKGQQTYQAGSPNMIAKSFALNNLISLAINEQKQIYSKSMIYYMNPNNKKIILDKTANKDVFVKFINSNKKVLANLNEDTYEHYVKAGMEKIYIPLNKNEKELTIKATNCDINNIKKVFTELYKQKYIKECKVIKANSEVYINCKTNNIINLPVVIIEKIWKTAGVFEIPTENRLSILLESVIEGEKCFTL